MVVCKFFLQGNCRFGDNCRNEHPRSGGSSSFGNNNRFGALQNTDNRFNSAQGGSKTQQWTIDAPQIEQIRLELGKERPKWVLTTYGAVKNTPGSLFEGNEYSAEEIRLRFYELATKGQEAQADQEAAQLWSKAETDMNNALNHASDVRKFMEDCEKKHPNRYDFLSFDGTKSRDEHSKAVEASQNAASATSAFGTGSSFGQPSTASSNPFSKPAAATFGQPSAPSAFGGNTFGKPIQSSAFGQAGFGASTTTNAFAQPSAASAFGSKPSFGASGFGQSSFGQPAQTAQPTSAFGQPAQPTQQTSAFGQPAQPSAFGTSGFGSATPAFGKPAAATSAFGQPTQTTSAFGQPSQPNSAFAQPAFGQAGFGQSGFGQPAKPAGFGQSGFGQTAQPTTVSAFGAAPGTGFGTATQSASNPFGAKDPVTSTPEVAMESDAPATSQPSLNPFGTATNTASPFGSQPTATQPQAVASAVPAASTNNSQAPHPLSGKPSAPLVFTQTLPAGPTQANMANQLSTYRGQAVQYLEDTSSVNPEGTTVPCYNRPDGKGPEKIWFPEGAAATEIVSLNREEKLADIQASKEVYTDEVKNLYKGLFETGRFEPGKMPLVPPMREWIAYDF